MVESESNWGLRITSNVSSDLSFLAGKKIVKEKRININASFHTFMTTKEEFLERILYLREIGIETSIVYVAYPLVLDRMESDIAFFGKHGFVVHVRRFQGVFRGKKYPYVYSNKERQLIAKYMDDGSIKYMLNQQISSGELTYSGFNFFVVDNVGNVGYDSNLFPLYSKYRCIFGNVHQNNFKPLFFPGKYPKGYEGTVDGVANLCKAKYKELEGNNVLSFAKQGGVYKDDEGTVHYKHLNTDFNNSQIRAEYNFPCRNFKDFYFKIKRGDFKFITLAIQAFFSKFIKFTKKENKKEILIRQIKKIIQWKKK